VRVSVELDDENTRQLVSLFRNIRGASFTVIAPESYNLFAHLYPNNTTFECILNSEALELGYKNHNNIQATFSIQLTEVVS